MARILIVEDETLIAMSLDFSLREAGHDVRTAGDGQQALDMLAEFLPDLVITDYMMPRMDGGELIATLRRREDTRTIPIVLTTSVPREKLGPQAVAHDAYLRKPVREDRLVVLVGELLQGR